MKPKWKRRVSAPTRRRGGRSSERGREGHQARQSPNRRRPPPTGHASARRSVMLGAALAHLPRRLALQRLAPLRARLSLPQPHRGALPLALTGGGARRSMHEAAAAAGTTAAAAAAGTPAPKGPPPAFGPARLVPAKDPPTLEVLPYWVAQIGRASCRERV